MSTTPNPRTPASKEEAIQGAIKDYRGGKFTSLTAAASAWGAPKSTVVYRAKGRKSTQKKASNQQALTPTEERVLRDYITEAQSWGYPWTPQQVRQAAEAIHGGELGASWVKRFVRRH